MRLMLFRAILFLKHFYVIHCFESQCTPTKSATIERFLFLFNEQVDNKYVMSTIENFLC